MNRRVVWFPAIAILLVVACSRSRPASESPSVDKLFAKWNRTDTPGCAVGVSRNGAIVYEHERASRRVRAARVGRARRERR